MATILPLAETQFNDALGAPLAGGSVYFYLPNTTTPKDTYQDSLQTITNSNPVILDSGGRAIIFGSGAYRQVVKDVNGNLIWDQTTSEAVVGQASFGGTSTGSANAQVVAAGTFSGADGSTINFVAGFTNTGAMTIAVGVGGSPIAVLKNGPSGPVNLASGDIAAGNIYAISYSVALGTFQLLQSIPPVITIASQAQAIAGTDNTTVMTPLRVNQAFFSHVPSVTVDNTVPRFDGTTGNTQTSTVTISDAGLVTAPGGFATSAGALPFSKAYQSTQQTVSTAGTLTLAHSLGASPKLIQISAICQIAERGYSINDEMIVNPSMTDPGSNGHGLAITVDATNVNIRFSVNTPLTGIDKSSGFWGNFTNANWKLIVRAWA